MKKITKIVTTAMFATSVLAVSAYASNDDLRGKTTVTFKKGEEVHLNAFRSNHPVAQQLNFLGKDAKGAYKKSVAVINFGASKENAPKSAQPENSAYTGKKWAVDLTNPAMVMMYNIELSTSGVDTLVKEASIKGLADVLHDSVIEAESKLNATQDRLHALALRKAELAAAEKAYNDTYKASGILSERKTEKDYKDAISAAIKDLKAEGQTAVTKADNVFEAQRLDNSAMLKEVLGKAAKVNYATLATFSKFASEQEYLARKADLLEEKQAKEESLKKSEYYYSYLTSVKEVAKAAPLVNAAEATVKSEEQQAEDKK